MMQRISCIEQPISSLASAAELREKKLKEILQQKEVLEANLRYVMIMYLISTRL
jgi:hypothetical protein